MKDTSAVFPFVILSIMLCVLGLYPGAVLYSVIVYFPVGISSMRKAIEVVLSLYFCAVVDVPLYIYTPPVPPIADTYLPFAFLTVK